MIDKKKTVPKKTTAKNVKSEFGVPVTGKTGSGILMPHLNDRFRVVFNDHSEQYHQLTQNVGSVDVDMIKKTVTVKVRDTAFRDNISRLADFAAMSGNIEVQYLNGVSIEPDKGIIFYGVTTGLTTSYNYANSNPTMLVLEFTFHDFNEYIPSED